MRKTCLGLVAALALVAQTAAAGQPERKNLQVFDAIASSVNRYSYFTIFDDISADVSEGVVTLSGKVTQPFKSGDIEKRVANVAGVTRVINRIEVLPLSGFDDELRYRIARSIYGNANFWNYAVMATPPIHIVVDRGRVTLTGVVQSEVDRALARSLAAQFGAFSVKNDLKTDAEMKDLREKS
jgi:hyperosmotically inducible periplasmic protein